MGSGGVAIAALPTVICLKVPFSDGLGGGAKSCAPSRLRIITSSGISLGVGGEIKCDRMPSGDGCGENGKP